MSTLMRLDAGAPGGLGGYLVQRPKLRRFLGSRSGRAGLVIVGGLILLAILAPLVSPYDPLAQSRDTLAWPTFAHPFGTDELGRDLLSRVIFGTGNALLVAIGSAAIAACVGVSVGLVAGYLGRWIDAILMRFVDVLLAAPSILLAMVVVAMLGPSTVNLLLAISLSSIPTFARLARASSLSLREQEYVLAARALGAPRLDVMIRTVLPNLVGPLLVEMVVTASHAIVVAAGLGFLGLGTPPPAPAWGTMLQTAQAYLYYAPLYGVFPGLALVVAIAGFSALGKGLQEAFGVMPVDGPDRRGGAS
jgi:peptide/nickel transport system permease protein